MRIREATIHDLEGIAIVHVDSWRSTYKGLIADSYLARLSVDKRIENWKWTFNNLHQNEIIYVALNDMDQIIGFSNGGKSRHTEYPYEAELYAIYLLQEYQGQGVGKLLLRSVVESLMRSGYTSMMVWVLDDNPAIQFYKAFGATQIGEKEISIGEDKYLELAYAWKSMDNLRLLEV